MSSASRLVAFTFGEDYCMENRARSAGGRDHIEVDDQEGLKP